MKMLGRIALVIAILACAGALFFASKLGTQKTEMKGQIAGLNADKGRLSKDLETTTTALTSTRQTLVKTQDELTTKVGELEGKKTELAQK